MEKKIVKKIIELIEIEIKDEEIQSCYNKSKIRISYLREIIQIIEKNFLYNNNKNNENNENYKIQN